MGLFGGQLVGDDTLRAWLMLAKRQPDPVYADDSVREELVESFVALRGANGYGDDVDQVPVTFRKLPGVERVARAHAKLEFSPVITERHAEAAMAMVGRSMQDYQKTEEGTLDADISETGKSKAQRDRKQAVAETIQELQADHDDGAVPVESVIESLTDDFERSKVESDIQKMLNRGEASEPRTGTIRYIGAY